MKILSALALGATLLASTSLAHAQNAAAQPAPAAAKPAGFMVAVQAWTFHRFTAFEAIEKTAQAGARFIELFPGQKLAPDDDAKVGPDMSAESLAKLKKKLADTKIQPVAFGVTGISRKEDDARKLFAWAKDLGIGVINTESEDALDTAEKMAIEFDMRVGIHEHPKRDNDPNYKLWDPNYVLSLVKNRDKRVGACADTGHWIRSGVRPMDALKILSGRIVSSHLKDRASFPDGHDVVWGTGVLGAREVLDELKQQKFDGPLSVEFEHNWDANVPDAAQCVAFVRGYEAATAPPAK
jgi:sugar phosphate isomerase/epimerase